MVERFRLGNNGLSLDMQMTLTDPVTFDYHLAKIMDREFAEVMCTTENARLFLEGGYEPSQKL